MIRMHLVYTANLKWAHFNGATFQENYQPFIFFEKYKKTKRKKHLFWSVNAILK